MEQMNNAPAPVKQSTTKTSGFLTGLILSLAVLVLLNLLSAFFFYRLDFSKGKIHTLSQTSKNLMRTLDDNVVVKIYMSNNLPPEYSSLARYARDILSEYKLFGRNRFRFEQVSTANEDEFRGQASRDNIFTQRVMILENDQQTVRDIFMGIAFEYKGNRESLNLTKEIEGRLEYEITSLMRRLTKASLPNVTVFQDSLFNPQFYQYFEHHMNQNYRVIPTNLTAPAKVSDVLVFTGIVDSLTNLQLYNLDQYIMNGGKVVFLQDRIAGLVQYGSAAVIESNLFDFLEHYGIDIKPNLVMDQNCAPINMSQRSGIFVVDVPMPFPPIPMVQGNNNSIISKGLTDIIIYLGSELNTDFKKEGVTITSLLQTSPNSGILTGEVIDISPNRFMEERLMSTLTLPPITLGAYYEGRFTSYFADKPEVASTEGFISEIEQGEIIVITDADMIRDFIVSASSANMMLILNAVDFLLKEISLSEVRSRTIPNSPLDISRWLYRMNIDPIRISEIEPSIRQLVKGVNLIMPSLLLIIYGLMRFFRLRRRRLEVSQRYNLIIPNLNLEKQEEEEEKQ